MKDVNVTLNSDLLLSCNCFASPILENRDFASLYSNFLENICWIKVLELSSSTPFHPIHFYPSVSDRLLCPLSFMIFQTLSCLPLPWWKAPGDTAQFHRKRQINWMLNSMALPTLLGWVQCHTSVWRLPQWLSKDSDAIQKRRRDNPQWKDFDQSKRENRRISINRSLSFPPSLQGFTFFCTMCADVQCDWVTLLKNVKLWLDWYLLWPKCFPLSP